MTNSKYLYDIRDWDINQKKTEMYRNTTITASDFQWRILSFDNI